MSPHMRRVLGFFVLAGVFAAGIFGGRGELWSSSARPLAPLPSAAQAADATPPPEPASLQDAFIRVGEQVGPAVVSVSTEQIERVRQYMRGHPFLGNPDEDFFRQFFGETPDAPQQERQFRRFGLGSGVIIDPQGYILTNEHVVADAEKITVTLTDGREMTGTVKGKDPRADLAVIKIDAKDLPVVKLGDSTGLKSGQWVVALGNPLGLAGIGPAAATFGSDPTLSVGIISALHRQLPRTSRYDRDYSDLVQTDATINPGNSGGPLVNLAGEVIGINVAIIAGPGNAYGFAIPISKAKTILDTLIEGKTVVYGWLGIQIQDITADVAEYYGLGERKGVLVYQVLPDSPAAQAGVKAGDIVRTVNGTEIEHSRQLIDLVSATKPGRTVKLGILREGKPVDVDVKIGERPVDLEQAAGATAEAWRGVKAGMLTPEQLERLGVGPGATGVLVVEVEAGSPAEQAGLREGDIINEINRQRIESLEDYRKVTSNLQGNALVRTNRGYVVIKAP